jgi:hypothetical protein
MCGRMLQTWEKFLGVEQYAMHVKNDSMILIRMAPVLTLGMYCMPCVCLVSVNRSPCMRPLAYACCQCLTTDMLEAVPLVPAENSELFPN